MDYILKVRCFNLDYGNLFIYMYHIYKNNIRKLKHIRIILDHSLKMC